MPAPLCVKSHRLYRINYTAAFLPADLVQSIPVSTSISSLGRFFNTWIKKKEKIDKSFSSPANGGATTVA